MTNPLMHEVSWLLRFAAAQTLQRKKGISDPAFYWPHPEPLNDLDRVDNIRYSLQNKVVPKRWWIDQYASPFSPSRRSALILDLRGKIIDNVHYYDAETKEGFVTIGDKQSLLGSKIHKVCCGGVVWSPLIHELHAVLSELPDKFHRFVIPVETYEEDEIDEFFQWAVKEQSG